MHNSCIIYHVSGLLDIWPGLSSGLDCHLTYTFIFWSGQKYTSKKILSICLTSGLSSDVYFYFLVWPNVKQMYDIF